MYTLILHTRITYANMCIRINTLFQLLSETEARLLWLILLRFNFDRLRVLLLHSVLIILVFIVEGTSAYIPLRLVE